MEKAFSYLFFTHLAITVSTMVSSRLGNMKFFFIRHELYVNEQHY